MYRGTVVTTTGSPAWTNEAFDYDSENFLHEDTNEAGKQIGNDLTINNNPINNDKNNPINNNINNNSYNNNGNNSNNNNPISYSTYENQSYKRDETDETKKISIISNLITTDHLPSYQFTNTHVNNNNPNINPNNTDNTSNRNNFDNNSYFTSKTLLSSDLTTTTTTPKIFYVPPTIIQPENKNKLSKCVVVLVWMLVLFLLALILALTIGLSLGLKKKSSLGNKTTFQPLQISTLPPPQPQPLYYLAYVRVNERDEENSKKIVQLKTIFENITRNSEMEEFVEVENVVEMSRGLYQIKLLTKDHSHNIHHLSNIIIKQLHSSTSPLINNIDINNSVWLQDSLEETFSNLKRKIVQTRPKTRGSCRQAYFPRCVNVGYDYSLDLSSNTNHSSISNITQPSIFKYGVDKFFSYDHVVQRNCSADAILFVCAMSFPKCLGVGENQIYIPPCRLFCEEIKKECRLTIDCLQFPNDKDSSVCVTSPTIKSTSSPFSCPANSYLCTNTVQCVLYNVVCDGKEDCDDGSDEENCQQTVDKIPITCSFEGHDWCFFSQSAISNYPWKLTRERWIDVAYLSVNKSLSSSSSSFSSTQLLNDWVLYASSANKVTNSSSIINTRPIYVAQNSCVSFSYVMAGRGEYYFKVYTSTQNSKTPKLIWWQNRGQLPYPPSSPPSPSSSSPPLLSLSSSPLSSPSSSSSSFSHWRRANIAIIPESPSFIRLLFEVVKGDLNLGNDVVIKEFSVHHGDCNRKECTISEKSCPNSYKCILKEQWCDNKEDCEDGEDERQCECKSEEWKCETGGCVKTWRRCDGVVDCSDASDEQHCVCPSNQRQCEKDVFKKCAMVESWCDGEKDCESGEDEDDCEECGMESKWRCDGVVDCEDASDETQCFKLGQDDLLLGYHDDDWLPVCAEGVSMVTMNLMCRHLYKKNLLTSKSMIINNINFLTLSNHSGLNATSQLFPLQQSECPTKEGFILKCQESYCGRTIFSQPPIIHSQPIIHSTNFLTPFPPVFARIINGVKSEVGEWLWAGALYYKGKQLCGVSLVDSRHVISAAHCFKDKNPRFYQVMLGSVDKKAPKNSNNNNINNNNINNNNNNKAIYLNLQQIFQHPDYLEKAYYWGNDIAIARLEREIIFNHNNNNNKNNNNNNNMKVDSSNTADGNLRPLCLPHNPNSKNSNKNKNSNNNKNKSNKNLNNKNNDGFDGYDSSMRIGPWSVCYGIGWGLTDFYNGSSDSRLLNKVKLKIWNEGDCVASQHVVKKGMLCAGYKTGYLAPCKGDSGGPLMCRNHHMQPWQLVGVYSFLTNGCNLTMKPPVYTNVSFFMDWIEKKLECPQWCDNSSRCIWDEELCNGVDDCEDKTDELNKSCVKTVSCTFEDHKMCGYTGLNNVAVWKHTFALNPISNSGPLADHTFKNKTGRYMISGGKKRSMIISPKFEIKHKSCLEFYLHTRGAIQQGKLKVHMVPANTTNPNQYQNYLVFTSNDKLSDSKWYPIRLDVRKGQYFVVFEASGSGEDFIAIDDVILKEGSCKEVDKCTRDEKFGCRGAGNFVECVNENEVRCNIVTNCVGVSDEDTCQDSKFHCNVEEFPKCSINQASTSVDDADWLDVKAEETHKMRSSGPPVDHTLGSLEGHVLIFDTSYETSGNLAVLEIPTYVFQSSASLACFQFYLSMVSTGSLKISQSTYKEKPGRLSHTIQSVNQPDWVMIEIQMDFFTSKLRIEGRSAFSHKPRGFLDYIAIDDITLYRGRCQNKIGIPALPSHIYKNKMNFFCHNNKKEDDLLCVDKNERCNLVKNCEDGSDEINCENSYWCGNSGKVKEAEVCNGYANCANAEDEIGCVKRRCDVGMFGCVRSGECVMQKMRCNGVSDCKDGSDEAGCSKNCQFGWYCETYKQCISDKCSCPDVWKSCACDENKDRFRCRNGQCILKSLMCNGEENCLDGSDEKRCACKPYQVRCPSDGKCIQKEWKCDGYKDCRSGWDEINCGVCGDDFKCKFKHECIPISKVCDSKEDCQDASDEFNCLKQNSSEILYINKVSYKMGFMPICMDAWNTKWSNKACENMGKGGKQAYTIPMPIPPTYKGSYLDTYQKNYELLHFSNFKKTQSCETGKLVSVSCAPAVQCGLKDSRSTMPYIVGGDTVTKSDTWPFVAALMKFENYICGGTIITPTFILTAAHCFKSGQYFANSLPHYYSIRVGSSNRLLDTKHLQKKEIKKIHMHSLYDPSNSHMDIALVELKSPLLFNRYIKPACLPEKGAKMPLCYVLGWGLRSIYEFDAWSQAIDLRQGKIEEMSTKQCNRLLPKEKKLTGKQMCVGYMSESIKPCRGDSGGPLLCKDLRNRWVVRGVVSEGANNFGMCNNVNVNVTTLTKVDMFAEWINTITKGEAEYVG